MVQTVSHGIKSQAIASALLKIHEKPPEKSSEKNHAAHYIPANLKSSPQFRGEILRPPVHEDFNSFLASSAGQMQMNFKSQFLDSAKSAASVQNHRFDPDSGLEKTGNQKLGASFVQQAEAKFPLDKIALIPLNDLTPKLLKNLTTQPVLAQQLVDKGVNNGLNKRDKGYGPRMITDPLIAMVTTDLEKFSLGLVGSVQARLNQTGDFNQESESEKPQTKALAKPMSTSHSEQASLLKREAIEVIREVREKFQQQLNAQYPHITVPIKHPEGMVDIHLRFDRKVSSNHSDNQTKGSVRVLFSGSNSQVVALLAQHREAFLKSITDQGYAIEPTQMQFNRQANYA